MPPIVFTKVGPIILEFKITLQITFHLEFNFSDTWSGFFLIRIMQAYLNVNLDTQMYFLAMEICIEEYTICREIAQEMWNPFF